MPKTKVQKKLFLSMKAYLVEDKIKLELDFCPPFEMLDASSLGKGSGGFTSQKAPSHYDVAELDRLFKYITKVIPCAIIESTEGKYAGISLDDHKSLAADVPYKSAQDNVKPMDKKTLLEIVKTYNKGQHSSRTSGKSIKNASHLDASSRLEEPGALQALSNMMSELKISRVHVDPDKNNTLKAQSSGGDVPPPPYPPR